MTDAPQAEPALPPETDAEPEEADGGFGPPFEKKSFGGQFIWAQGDGYSSKILRVKAGEKVVISTRGRKDMIVMLTGGRGVLEVIQGEDVDLVELLPVTPVPVTEECEYRLVAVTEVELWTIHSPLPPPQD